jgi:alcohol dehydrogenase class IV
MMDDRIIQMLPKMYFPGAVFTGANSLYYLKTIDPTKTLILASETAWGLHQERLGKHIQAQNITKISGEPRKSDMEELHTDIEKKKHECVIGFGGGSVMDLAKTSKMKDPGIKLVLVPTTSGTGSESSRYALLINEKKEKEAMTSEKLVPDVVLLDHTFSTSLPKFETAYTSLDALSHSIEGLVSKMSNPVSDSLAITSIDMIARSVKTACENPQDMQSRSNLQTAGFFGGLVQSSASVGLVHAFANYFGPQLGIPHGVAIGAFLIDVLKLNMQKTDRYEKLRNSGFFSDGDITGRLKELMKSVGFYEHYKKPDLGSFDLDLVADRIKNDVCTKTNPYNPSQDDIKDIINNVNKVDG